MTSINEIAEDYVARYVELDPQFATELGVAGHDHELTDYSLEGFAERNTLTASTLAAIRALEPADENERVAKEAMEERLALSVETYEAGDETSALNVLASPLQSVRSVFDQMSTEGAENHANIAKRLAAVPEAAIAGEGSMFSQMAPSSLAGRGLGAAAFSSGGSAAARAMGGVVAEADPAAATIIVIPALED